MFKETPGVPGVLGVGESPSTWVSCTSPTRPAFYHVLFVFCQIRSWSSASSIKPHRSKQVLTIVPCTSGCKGCVRRAGYFSIRRESANTTSGGSNPCAADCVNSVWSSSKNSCTMGDDSLKPRTGFSTVALAGDEVGVRTGAGHSTFLLPLKNANNSCR